VGVHDVKSIVYCTVSQEEVWHWRVIAALVLVV